MNNLRTSLYVLLSVQLLTAAGCDGSDAGKQLRTSAQGVKLENSVGVPECDSYLAQYTACVRAAVPSSQQNQVLSGLQHKREMWAKLAESEFKKQSLGRMCSSAIKTAREELHDWNCTWEDTACGNGSIEMGEECDDGNLTSGDGCNASCFSEGSSPGDGDAGDGDGDTSPPSDNGASICNSSNSIDLGALNNTVQVSNDACLKVENGYPDWWDSRSMKVQNESGGNLPVTFHWLNACASGSGSETFVNEWQNITFGPTSEHCPTFIKLAGDGAASFRIKYYSP